MKKQTPYTKTRELLCSNVPVEVVRNKLGKDFSKEAFTDFNRILKVMIPPKQPKRQRTQAHRVALQVMLSDPSLSEAELESRVEELGIDPKKYKTSISRAYSRVHQMYIRMKKAGFTQGTGIFPFLPTPYEA